MSAEVIDLLPRRVDEAAKRIAKEEPGLSEWACRKHANREAVRSLPRPTIGPDDPIFGLWDAYKQAEAAYRKAMADMARRHGLPVLNMAKIAQRARGGPRPSYLTPAELKAKYKAMSPEEKARFSREFCRITGAALPD